MIPLSEIAALSNAGIPRRAEHVTSVRPLHAMNLNEAPFPPSPKAIAAMEAALREVNRYPDHYCEALGECLSRDLRVPAGRIVFGAGSSELLYNAARISLEHGDEVVAPVPSFPAYARAVAMCGGKLVSVPVRADGVNDVDAMLKAITQHTRVVFAATPNNPTGWMMTGEEVARLARDVPETALLVLDEAYYEFGRLEGGEEHLPAMARRKGPWIITRTFSKAYGLAGLRIGYAIASSEEVARNLDKLRNSFNINHVVQAGALAALDDPAHTKMLLEGVRGERIRLVTALKGLGLAPLPTAANFVTVRLPTDAAAAASALQAEGILVQALGWPQPLGALRITVGSGADTDALIEVLRRHLGKIT